MKERKYGKIINIASHAGKFASPSNPAYGASKASVIHLTQSLALRWASNNINVNVICPGSIWTPMWVRIAERIRRQNVSKNKIDFLRAPEIFFHKNCRKKYPSLKRTNLPSYRLTRSELRDRLKRKTPVDSIDGVASKIFSN